VGWNGSFWWFVVVGRPKEGIRKLEAAPGDMSIVNYIPRSIEKASKHCELFNWPSTNVVVGYEKWSSK
jgi:hypothetical protein